MIHAYQSWLGIRGPLSQIYWPDMATPLTIAEVYVVADTAQDYLMIAGTTAITATWVTDTEAIPLPAARDEFISGETGNLVLTGTTPIRGGTHLFRVYAMRRAPGVGGQPRMSEMQPGRWTQWRKRIGLIVGFQAETATATAGAQKYRAPVVLAPER